MDAVRPAEGCRHRFDWHSPTQRWVCARCRGEVASRDLPYQDRPEEYLTLPGIGMVMVHQQSSCDWCRGRTVDVVASPKHTALICADCAKVIAEALARKGQ